MSAIYLKDRKVTIVTIWGSTEHTTIVIPDHWRISAIEQHLKEVKEFVDDAKAL